MDLPKLNYIFWNFLPSCFRLGIATRNNFFFFLWWGVDDLVMRKRWSSSHIYCDWKVAGAETRGASVAHTCCHSSADSTDCHGAADGPVTSLPPHESSFSISNPWDKFGLTFKKEAPVSPVWLPDHQGWKERELMHVPVCLLGLQVTHVDFSFCSLSFYTVLLLPNFPTYFNLQHQMQNQWAYRGYYNKLS